jgi:hypothetical protein
MAKDGLWRAIAAPVRKGYLPQPKRELSPRWWLRDAGGEQSPAMREVPFEALAAQLGAFAGGIGFILPTALQRARENLPDKLAELWEQSEQAHRDNAAPLLIVVGLQWWDDEGEALALLERALMALPEARKTLAVVGLTLLGPGKVVTLRTCLPLVSALGLRGLGWVDDDVLLDRGCLARLVEGFLQRQAGPCVVGATKVPHQREEASSRWLFRFKQRMAPAMNYPHGCCMLVDAALFDRGIPDRYTCDDGYFCYEMLQRVPDEASFRMALIPEARCHYLVGAERGRLVSRLRRILLHHVIFLADYPPPVGSKYLGEYLYPGFWPLSRVPPRGAPGARRWLLQSFHFALLSGTALELWVRGVIGRPLRAVRWGS